MLLNTQIFISTAKANINNYFSLNLTKKVENQNITNSKTFIYRFFLLNQLYTDNSQSVNVTKYNVFRCFNLSNYILNKNFFLWWLGNKRLSTTLDQTTFYKNNVFSFNNTNDYNSMYNTFLYGFKTM